MAEDFERVSFASPRLSSHDPPAIDFVEWTSVYEGPLGPVFAGYGDDDRETVVVGPTVGEWRMDWGVGRSVLDEDDRARALAGFCLHGDEQYTLAWLRNDSKAGHAVHVVGAGGRWVVAKQRRVGLAVLRGRDEVVGVADGGKPRLTRSATSVEAVLVTLAHTGLANLISPPSPYKLPDAGFDGP